MRHEKAMSRYETWKRVAVMQGGPSSLQSNRTVDKGAVRIVADDVVTQGKVDKLLKDLRRSYRCAYRNVCCM